MFLLKFGFLWLVLKKYIFDVFDQISFDQISKKYSILTEFSTSSLFLSKNHVFRPPIGRRTSRADQCQPSSRLGQPPSSTIPSKLATSPILWVDYADMFLNFGVTKIFGIFMALFVNFWSFLTSNLFVKNDFFGIFV